LVYRVRKRERFPRIGTLIFLLAFSGVVFWHSGRKSFALERFNWKDAVTVGRSRLKATGIASIATSLSERTATTVSALAGQVVKAALRRVPSNSTDRLYFELSSRIAAHVVAHDSEDWFGYFEWLRALVVRVVSESTEDRLSVAEKNALIQRLDDYVIDLENLWPILGSERIGTKAYSRQEMLTRQ
jgi:hypothetical protein